MSWQSKLMQVTQKESPLLKTNIISLLKLVFKPPFGCADKYIHVKLLRLYAGMVDYALLAEKNPNY